MFPHDYFACDYFGGDYWPPGCDTTRRGHHLRSHTLSWWMRQVRREDDEVVELALILRAAGLID